METLIRNYCVFVKMKEEKKHDKTTFNINVAIIGEINDSKPKAKHEIFKQKNIKAHNPNPSKLQPNKLHCIIVQFRRIHVKMRENS